VVSYHESGANHPLRDWLVQRITATLMAVCTLGFLAMLVAAPPIDHSSWRQLFLPPWVRLAALLFLFSAYWHAWIGVRNICMDYVGNVRLRQILYALVIGALTAYAAWTVQILWGKW